MAGANRPAGEVSSCATGVRVESWVVSVAVILEVSR